MRKSLWITSALLVVIALLVSACAAPAAPAPAGGEAAATEAAGETAAACEGKDPVTLQLKWVAQAQFCGY